MRVRRRLLVATLVAVGLHVDLLLLFMFLLRGGGPRPAPPEGEEPIALRTVDDAEARELLGEIERPEEPQQEEKKKDENAIAPGQVIDQPEPVHEERPREARFAAERDNSTPHETKRDAPATPREGAAASPPAIAPPTPPLMAMRDPAEKAERQATPRRSAPPEQAVDPDGVRPTAPGERPSEEATPGGARAAGPVQLTPNTSQLARALGGGPLDHLADVDDGDMTSLNARSWKFASFFNRVKRQVAEHWAPASEYGRRDPTGNVYGNGQWVTLVQIQLKPDGSLLGVVISKPSGLEFLDDVAVEAVKEGGPFPNPPTQLVDESGIVRFKFGFYFDVGTGPRMKVYRYSGL